MLKRVFGLVLVVVVLGTIAGSASAESIKIGITLPLTGAQAAFGEILNNAYNLAADEINAAGGVNGNKLELLITDHQGQPELAMSAVENMINSDKVALLLGGYASATAYAIAQVAQKNSIPYIIDVASSARITREGWQYVFRFSETSSMAMNGPFAFMQNVAKPKSLALVYENSTFGTDSIEVVEDWAQQQGIEIKYSGLFNSGLVDFKPVLSRVKEAEADIVIFVAYLTDAVVLMRQSQELDISPKMFIGAGAGFVLEDFAKQVGAASQYVGSASIWQPDIDYPGVSEFVNKWTAKFNSAPTYHAAAGYSAIYLIKDVLERSTSLSNEDLYNALRETDLWTVYGNIKFKDFDDYINQSEPLGVMTQWFDGVMHTVWPADFAIKEYVFPVPVWNER